MIELAANQCKHSAPRSLIGIKRTQRHEEVHVGARKKLAVEGAPVQAWRRLLKRAVTDSPGSDPCRAARRRGGARPAGRAAARRPPKGRAAAKVTTRRGNRSARP